ncbi:MAG: TIGR01841 family phasin [Gammaproteobacteria bacterium]
MNANITETYETAAKAASTAANNAGQLVIKNIEKVIELQMGTVRSYADAMLSNAREVLEIKDVNSARAYFEKQPEVVRGLVQKMAKDSGEMMEIGRAYVDEAQALFRKSADDFGAVVETNEKKA